MLPAFFTTRTICNNNNNYIAITLVLTLGASSHYVNDSTTANGAAIKKPEAFKLRARLYKELFT
jgi:hypothetical protein